MNDRKIMMNEINFNIYLYLIISDLKSLCLDPVLF